MTICGDWLYIEGLEQIKQDYWSFLKIYSENYFKNKILQKNMM